MKYPGSTNVGDLPDAGSRLPFGGVAEQPCLTPAAFLTITSRDFQYPSLFLLHLPLFLFVPASFALPYWKGVRHLIPSALMHALRLPLPPLYFSLSLCGSLFGRGPDNREIPLQSPQEDNESSISGNDGFHGAPVSTCQAPSTNDLVLTFLLPARPHCCRIIITSLLAQLS